MKNYTTGLDPAVPYSEKTVVSLFDGDGKLVDMIDVSRPQSPQGTLAVLDEREIEREDVSSPSGAVAPRNGHEDHQDDMEHAARLPASGHGEVGAGDGCGFC